MITLHNSPMFHVKLGAAGFVVWGVTVKTPSKSTNSAGTALTYSSAHNTDGIDPGEAASNGFIVCSQISDGDDHIAIKGRLDGRQQPDHRAQPLRGRPRHVDRQRDHRRRLERQRLDLRSMHGTGTGGGSSNGIRIKSDSSRGGLVNNVSYSDVCMRGV